MKVNRADSFCVQCYSQEIRSLLKVINMTNENKKELEAIRQFSFPYIYILMVQALKLIRQVILVGYDPKSAVIKRLKSYSNTIFYSLRGKTFRKEVMLHTIQKAHILSCWALSGNDLNYIVWEHLSPDREIKSNWVTDPVTGFSTPKIDPPVLHGSGTQDSYSPRFQRFLDARRRDDLRQQKKIRRKFMRPVLVPRKLSDLPKNQYYIDFFDQHELDIEDLDM